MRPPDVRLVIFRATDPAGDRLELVGYADGRWGILRNDRAEAEYPQGQHQMDEAVEELLRLAGVSIP
jgi:hypothetical protein